MKVDKETKKEAKKLFWEKFMKDAMRLIEESDIRSKQYKK